MGEIVYVALLVLTLVGIFCASFVVFSRISRQIIKDTVGLIDSLQLDGNKKKKLKKSGYGV